ncbi:unnamed protein product [Rotaria sp. Silwood2]|nr:unnamed protein product [Rotaria sp. Silwood2]
MWWSSIQIKQNCSHKEKDNCFITRAAWLSSELNVHCLTAIIILVSEGRLPPCAINTHLFSSQLCEATFLVRLITDPVYITINAVYFPMNPNGQQHETNAVEIFYDDLQRTVDKVPSNDLLLLMGDFNARAGKQQHKTSGNIVGLHAIDHINENGQRLIGFCSMNNLVISNTFFEHKPIHKMTWMHPGNKKWHMIDDTIVNKKFRSIGEDVRVHRLAVAIIGTDHHLLPTKLRFHLKSRKKLNQRRPSRLDR